MLPVWEGSLDIFQIHAFKYKFITTSEKVHGSFGNANALEWGPGARETAHKSMRIYVQSSITLKKVIMICARMTVFWESRNRKSSRAHWLPSLVYLLSSRPGERVYLRQDGWCLNNDTTVFFWLPHVHAHTSMHTQRSTWTYTSMLFLKSSLCCVFVHFVFIYVCTPRFPRRSEEGIESPGTRVADSCEWPVSSDNQTWFLCESSTCPSLLSLLCSPACKFWRSIKKILCLALVCVLRGCAKEKYSLMVQTHSHL